VVEFLVGLIPLIIFIAYVSRVVPSRIIEIPITIIRGAQAVSGLMGEMILIDSRIDTIRKYTFASLLNCSRSASE
jgi:hypothetical protein